MKSFSNNSKLILPIVPSVLMVLLIVGLVFLGFWQVKRLEWKVELLSAITNHLNQPPVPIETILMDIGNKDWRYQRVKLTGKFIHDQEFKLMPKSHKGRPGYNLVTPFKIKNSGTVLVDRGFVRTFVSSKEISRSEEEITILGMIQNSQKPGYFSPENNFRKMEMFTLNIPEIAEKVNFTTLLPFYIIDVGFKDPQDQEFAYPIVMGPRLDIPNNHLAYAITWFSLALTAFIMYCIFVYQWNTRLRHLNGAKAHRPI